MNPQHPIHDLLPHSAPMVFLERIVSYDEHRLCATVPITADSVFAEAEGVPAWVGLEYMGQAIAALAGIHARANNEPVRLGFLVSSRSYKPQVSHFAPGWELTITIEAVTLNTTGLRVFECSIYNADNCLVTANLNVYMPDDVDAFMKESSQ